MAPSRRQPIKDAPRGSRERLGMLLLARRQDDLGHLKRPGFEEAAGINRRMSSDIETGRRDSFDINTLKAVAAAYQVTYESLLDVAWGRAGELTPAVTAHAGVAAAAGTAPQPGAETQDGGPLFSDAGAVAADRPYAEEIHARLRQLERRGVTAEAATGRQVFPRPGEEDDARFWDKCAADMWDLENRVWLAARIRRQQAARNRDDLPGAS